MATEEETRAAEYQRQQVARAVSAERNERVTLRSDPAALRRFRLAWKPLIDALNDNPRLDNR